MKTLSRPISSLLSRFPLFLWRQRILVALLIVVAIFATEFYALKIPKANAAYTIANSARFISGNSDYLTKTPGGAGSRTTWTYSVWVKRGALGGQGTLISAGTDMILYDGSTDNIQWQVGGATDGRLDTSAKFRDPAAWTHLVFVFDTTNATANDRMKVYVNGTQLTDFSSRTNPSLSYATGDITDATAHNIGRRVETSSLYLDSYLADAYLIDGAALAPTCFGETDSNGYWRPKTYSTASPCAAYGTNGFKLAFGTGSALGTDTLDAFEPGLAEKMEKFIEKNCRVTVDWTRPDGAKIRVTGFDFIDHASAKTLQRPPMVSPEWSFQMANAYRRLEDDFAKKGETQKSEIFRSKREKLIQSVMAMAVSTDGALAFPYASLPDALIGHEYRTPLQGNFSMIGVSYAILALKGFDPLRPPPAKRAG